MVRGRRDSDMRKIAYLVYESDSKIERICGDTLPGQDKHRLRLYSKEKNAPRERLRSRVSPPGAGIRDGDSVCESGGSE
jgi:hypothetical protein